MPVSDFDRGLRRVVSDLAETLADAGGAGLAAPQIGVNLRVFTYVVLDTEMPEYGSMGHIVNPVLVEQSPDEVTDIEGCLSIPGLEYELARSRRVVAEGSDMYGETVRIEGTRAAWRAAWPTRQIISTVSCSSTGSTGTSANGPCVKSASWSWPERTCA